MTQQAYVEQTARFEQYLREEEKSRATIEYLFRRH